MQNSKILEVSPAEATHIKMLNGSFYAGNNKLRPDGTVLRSSAVTTVHTLRSLDDIRTIVALEKKAQAGQENVKYWATQFNELRSQFDEMQKRAEAAEAQDSRVQELEQQKDTLETELLALTMATGRHETWELGKQLFKDFQVSNFNKGVQACIEELERCHEVTLKENKDFEGARDIEVLIDHLHQVEKDDA